MVSLIADAQKAFKRGYHGSKYKVGHNFDKIIVAMPFLITWMKAELLESWFYLKNDAVFTESSSENGRQDRLTTTLTYVKKFKSIFMLCFFNVQYLSTNVSVRDRDKNCINIYL